MEHGEGEEDTQQAPDPRLDFTSSEFDPSLALQTEGLQPPVPDAPVLDNISKCSSLLPADATPAELAASQKSAQKTAEDIAAAQAKKAKAAALKQRAQAAAQRAEASVTIGSLSSIMEKAAVGPLAVLAKWQASGQRVLVITRHAAGVRGRAVGNLKGFDKFMNLLLADVEETYTVIVKVPRVKQQQCPQQLAMPASANASEAGSSSGCSAAGSSNQQLQPPACSADGRQQQQQQQQRRAQQQEQPQQKHEPLPPLQQQQQLVEQVADQHQQHQMELQVHQQHDYLLQQQQPQQQQLKQQQGGGASGRSRVRWCRKQEQRFRRLDQVLLVGDNVVLVSCQQQPPAAPKSQMTS